MFYKNTSYTEKTFYGVKFKPGETKEVDGIISNRMLCDPRVLHNRNRLLKRQARKLQKLRSPLFLK